MKKLLVFSLILVVAVFGFSKKQVLHMYTALDVNEAKIYIEAFEKATGIDVDWVRMSAGEILARLKAEKKNPQASIWFGGPVFEFISAKKDGLLDKYVSPNAKYIPKEYMDPEGYWTGFYIGAIGFASNKDILKELGVEPPRSWDDLLKPEFKGRISMAYPYTSGTAYTILATTIAQMGEEKAFEWWKKFNKQIHHYNKSGSACVTQVGLGEVAVGIAFAHDIVKKGISKGYPVVLTFPTGVGRYPLQEGTGYEIGAMALIKGGPEPELAKKFIDWMLTVDAQNLMKKWFRIPLNPEAEVAEGAVKITDVKTLPLDFEWFGKNHDRLIDRWKNEIQFGE